MLLNLTNYSIEPIHNQIVNQVLLRIFEEDKLPGDQIDSIGKISRQHHISKTSIRKAFNKLEQLGVIFSNDTKHYVSNISTRALKLLIERDYNNTNNISEYDSIKTELEAAKQIQNGLLPNTLPSNDSIDVAAYSTISDDVGGDFYDFFSIDENKYGIVIGDASGKGFPAAMLISQIQAIIKSDLSLNRSINQTVQLINSYMNTYSSAKYFATLFYGIIDLKNGELTYINGGHNFPIIVSSGLKINKLTTTGPALGLIANADYEVKSIYINPRDILFLYTDGLSERMNHEALQFGEERIIKILKDKVNENSKKMVSSFASQLSHFSSSDQDTDDTTFMTVKIKKTGFE